MSVLEPAESTPPTESDDRTFARLAEPLRRELKVHCYRMLGAFHEAEDAVQDTYLRAWRSFSGLDERGSIKAWLYRIATNVCFDALARRKHARRILPHQYAPATDEFPNGVPAPDVAWLEPYPDAELGDVADDAPDPEARYSMNEAVRLAFVAAIQELPPRQRAVLMLCDVLGWSATETAALLGASTASVSSALQRSRATLARRYPAGRAATHSTQPTSAQQNLLGRYMRAWEELDADRLVTLLKEDAAYTMPPLPQWYVGREPIAAFFTWAFGLYDSFRMIPIGANGQPAFAAYSRAKPTEPWAAHSIQVLDLAGDAIGGLTLFARPDAPRLFSTFGLPLVIRPEADSYATSAGAPIIASKLRR
jgi:RNA polymerase sigma-70 factor (ECF subfamily)